MYILRVDFAQGSCRVRPPDATRQTPQPLSQSLKRCSNHECYVSAIETCLRLAISTMSGNSRCRLRRRTRRRNENGLLAAFSKTAALPGLSSCARNTPSGKRSTAGTRRALPTPEQPPSMPLAHALAGHGWGRKEPQARAAGSRQLAPSTDTGQRQRRPPAGEGGSKAVGPESKSVVGGKRVRTFCV
jgi:hypothetical protein